MGLNADFARWLYRGGAPNRVARAMNALSATIFSTGLVGHRQATLEVTGRRSGRPIRLPVVVADHAGQRYLISMLGPDANWVRNVAAANGRAVLIARGRHDVRLVEVDDAERPAIIHEYLRYAPGARPHLPVDQHSSLEAIARVASDIPVLRIEVVA